MTRKDTWIIIVTSILVVASIGLVIAWIGNYLRIQTMIGQQRISIQKAEDQEQQRREAYRLVEMDEINRWKRTIENNQQIQQDNLNNLRKRVDDLDRQLISGIPFQAVGVSGAFSNQKYLVTVQAIDTVSEDGKSMGGRIIGEFDDVSKSIEFLEGIK